jgi:hypothetical protein
MNGFFRSAAYGAAVSVVILVTALLVVVGGGESPPKPEDRAEAADARSEAVDESGSVDWCRLVSTGKIIAEECESERDTR